MPLGVIAEQLGHADTRMTEKHYAHLAPCYVADTIRAHFPTLGIAGEGAVSPTYRLTWRMPHVCFAALCDQGHGGATINPTSVSVTEAGRPGDTRGRNMEVSKEKPVECDELTAEDLAGVSGGWYSRYVRAVAYSGTNTGDSATSTNTQLWVQRW
jgi:hypothetical protein